MIFNLNAISLQIHDFHLIYLLFVLFLFLFVLLIVQDDSGAADVMARDLAESLRCSEYLVVAGTNPENAIFVAACALYLCGVDADTVISDMLIGTHYALCGKNKDMLPIFDAFEAWAKYNHM